MQDEYTQSSVGERIRRVIAARGQSLKAFSDQSGIPYRSLQDYVAGKNRPGFDQLQRMAVTGVDISYLLTGEYGGTALRAFAQSVDKAVLLSSDREVAKLVFNGAIAAADNVNETRISNGSGHMSAQDILDTLQYALSLAVKVSSEMDDELCNLRKRGVSASAVTSVILEAVSAALLKRSQVDNASKQVPQSVPQSLPT